jgi:hypothetical protein
MKFFPIFGILFLVASVYNLVQRDYANMAGTLVFAGALLAIYFLRRRKAAADFAAISQHTEGTLRCCKCGSDQDVSLRAYLLTYSVVFFTSKSAGAFRPICGACSVKAGLPYSFGTFLLGWWGIPWGPIYTVQAITRNFRGGVVQYRKITPGPSQPMPFGQAQGPELV